MPNTSEYTIPKYYSPDQSLVDYMHDLLQITHNKKKLDAGAQATEKGRLRTAKSRHILPEILFPAMANLTFFFEATELFPELLSAGTLESDIKELLGIRRLNPRAYNYAFMFMSLISNMIMISRTSEDFRLKLLHKLADIIWFKVTGLKLLETQSASSRVLEDIGRSTTWLEMLSSRVKDEYDLSRLAPRYDKEELDKLKDDKEREKKYIEEVDNQTLRDFEMYVKQNSPSRTFDFDTKKLIEN